MKKFIFSMTAIVIVMFIATCDNGNDNGGDTDDGLPSGKAGVISFVSPPPDAVWEIRVTPVTVTAITDLTSGYAATSSSNAADFINGKAYLNPIALKGFPAFNPNGTYTIAYSPSGGVSWKKKAGVQFVNGSASLNFSTMDTVD